MGNSKVVLASEKNSCAHAVLGWIYGSFSCYLTTFCGDSSETDPFIFERGLTEVFTFPANGHDCYAEFLRANRFMKSARQVASFSVIPLYKLALR